MKKILQFIKNFYLPAAIILTLAFSRIIPHPWNFTPILSAGIFLGFYFRQIFLGIFIVIFSMFLGDLYFGFHNTMIFTYLGLIISVLVGSFIKNLYLSKILVGSILSSVSFFLITNFGVWISSNMYSKNFEGLLEAYILGLPFFHNTLLSTIFYLIFFELIYEISVKEKVTQGS